MNNKNPRIFKFPRKEVQSSQEINKKKAPINPQKQRQSIKIENVPKESPKEMKNLVILKESESDDSLDEEITSHIESKATLKQSQQMGKVDQFIQMSEKGVLFEKRLTKLAIPDAYEKLKMVNKLQGKLLNCLEKKKAVIPMKKLVNVDMLNDLLNKKPRKVVTNCSNYIEKLDVEAQSLRKIDSKESREESVQLPPQKVEGKVKMSLIPLRVPNFQEQQEEEHFFQAEDTSNFVFQQAEPNNDFGFFRNSPQDMQSISNPFSQSSSQQMDLYQQKLNQINQKRQQSELFFKQIDEYAFDSNLFQRQSSKSSEKRQNRGGFDIAKIKVPNMERNRQTIPKYGIFSIEEEVSTFFTPQNEVYNQPLKMPNNTQAGEKYWPSNDSSSPYSYNRDFYY